jgi:hypothetical protein
MPVGNTPLLAAAVEALLWTLTQPSGITLQSGVDGEILLKEYMLKSAVVIKTPPVGSLAQSAEVGIIKPAVITQ